MLLSPPESAARGANLVREAWLSGRRVRKAANFESGVPVPYVQGPRDAEGGVLYDRAG
jgi:hypothetical protein